MRRLKKAQGSRLKARGKRRQPYSLQPTAYSQTADLLVEIGTEELPAAYLDGAITQLREEAEQLFCDAHLDVAEVEAFGTPRRLVVVVRGVRGIQRNPPEELRGPSKRAAFDAEGKPTEALKGFLRARGGKLSQIKVVQTDKGDYIYLQKPERHVDTTKVLPGLIEQLLGRLRFPKTMRWDGSGLRFARPIRWLVVVYGTKPIRVSIGRLISGRSTWVGGPKRPKAVSVTRAAQYLMVLNRHGIVLDQRQRRERIEQLVKRLARQNRGVPVPEIVTHGLLDEVTHLIEQPVALVGAFDPKYLVLPREVLLASMAKYQRVFAIQSHSGKLLPRFVAILDGTPRKLTEVRRVYEHILNARLADSLLFWNRDKNRQLSQMNQELDGVTFHEQWGSMAKKMLRLCSLTSTLVGQWGLTSQEREPLREACEFSKSDLVTNMVKEFPTLQGTMGKYYAQAAGKSPVVANAIAEQYLPLGGQLPRTLVGSALAILDKYDTLACYFTIGIEPTGDEDPFGLRRAAQGIVEIAWAVHRPLQLEGLFLAWQAQAQPAHGKAHIGKQIQDYIQDRLYTFAWPDPVPSRDLIDAVLNSPCDDLVDAMDRICALQQLDGKQTLLRAAKVVERTHNILRAAAVRQAEPDPERFQEPLERQLWKLYDANKEKVLRLIEKRSYAEATTMYGEVFFDVLHEFFERVFVNVEDEAIQQNRLALMRAINTLYTERVADLSKLAILQPKGTL